MVGLLIIKAYDMGFEMSLGWAERPAEFAKIYAKRKKGIPSSLHTSRLAIDLNLFVCGRFLSKTSDHQVLGEWWEAEGRRRGYPLVWGGRFKKPDGNHYSWEWRGRM
jgi:hypothetical protein